jgi:hypothetical protein
MECLKIDTVFPGKLFLYSAGWLRRQMTDWFEKGEDRSNENGEERGDKSMDID